MHQAQPLRARASIRLADLHAVTVIRTFALLGQIHGVWLAAHGHRYTAWLPASPSTEVLLVWVPGRGWRPDGVGLPLDGEQLLMADRGPVRSLPTARGELLPLNVRDRYLLRYEEPPPGLPPVFGAWAVSLVTG